MVDNSLEQLVTTILEMANWIAAALKVGVIVVVCVVVIYWLLVLLEVKW